MKNSNILIFFVIVGGILLAMFSKSNFQLTALNPTTVVSVIAILAILAVLCFFFKGKKSGFGKNAVIIAVFLVFLVWLLN